MSGEFAITRHKGVRITFSNGYAISIQWGPGNYCERYDMADWDLPKKSNCYVSKDAEIAILKDGKFVTDSVWEELYGEPLGDDVKGKVTPEQAVEIMSFLAKK